MSRVTTRIVLGLSLIVGAHSSGGALLARQAPSPIAAASAALGAASLRSIEYSGWGSDFVFGQAYDGASAWPEFHLSSYAVSIDYASSAMLDDRRRSQAENPPRGGGFQPLIGERRQIWAVRGDYAWDVVGESATPAAVERDLRGAVEGRTTQIWMTPHGFIKAAAAGTATTRVENLGGEMKTVIVVTTPTQVTLEGVLDARNLVERVETRLSHPMLGDIMLEAVFEDYQDFGGVQFPTRIVQREAGYPVLDVTITNVRPNAAVTIEVPDSIRQAQPAASAPVVAEEISDGVWVIPGGAKSVAVEFGDHVVVIDAPESEARSLAALEAITAAVPGKPVRYVVNTHSHFDHASGLRTYAAVGATVVTHAAHVPYYEQIWSYPRTIAPDRLSRSGRTASLEGVVGARTFDDGTRRLVVYPYDGNLHNAGMLMAFLPKEQILIEADSYTPPSAPGEEPGGFSNLVHFYDAVRALRLDVNRIVPIHGPLATFEEVGRAVDTFGRSRLWVVP